MINEMGLTDVLEGLDPLERRVVSLVYFEGRTAKDAAHALAVDRSVVGSALASAFREVAHAVMSEDPIFVAECNEARAGAGQHRRS